MRDKSFKDMQNRHHCGQVSYESLEQSLWELEQLHRTSISKEVAEELKGKLFANIFRANMDITCPADARLLFDKTIDDFTEKS